MRDELFVILAAGFGSRLLPYTANKPKPLVEINGRSMLSRITQSAQLVGINTDNMVIATGHCAKSLINEGIRTAFNPIYARSNMFASLFMIDDFSNYQNVIVHYGDTIFTPRTLHSLTKSRDYNIVLSDKLFLNYWQQRSSDYISDLETFQTDDNNNLITLGERLINVNDANGQFTGLMKFSGPQLQNAISHAQKNISADIFLNWYMTDFIRYVIQNNLLHIKVLETTDPWVEVDTTSDLTSTVTQERICVIDDHLTKGILA